MYTAAQQHKQLIIASKIKFVINNIIKIYLKIY